MPFWDLQKRFAWAHSIWQKLAAMKSISLALGFLFVCGLTLYAANHPAMAAEWYQSESHDQGIVKGIVSDDVGSQVILQLIENRKEPRERVKICADSTRELTPRLQEAMEQGRTVQLHFRGSFNRCLSSVDVKPNPPDREI